MPWSISAGIFCAMGIFPDSRVFLLWALLLLTLPLPWLLAALGAGAFHELCHFLALYAAGTPVRGFQLGPRGARILTGPLDPKTELICASAGPLGSLFLLLFLRLFPRMALCGAFQGLFNLLPIYPMDGGRVLRSALALLGPWKEKFLAK